MVSIHIITGIAVEFYQPAGISVVCNLYPTPQCVAILRHTLNEGERGMSSTENFFGKQGERCWLCRRNCMGRDT